jgi:hypothetical protein
MSIWDELLTKDEYRRRLFAAKADQRRRDANLSFEQKVEIVLALQEVSRELHDAGNRLGEPMRVHREE